jgi:hypothetical protein
MALQISMKIIRHKNHSVSESKFSIFFLIILFITGSAISRAQLLPGQDTESNRNFDNNDPSGFVNLTGKLSRISDETGIELGFGFSGYITKYYSAGIELSSIITSDVELGNGSFLRFNYGGVRNDFHLRPAKWLNLSAGFSLNLGFVTRSSDVNFGVSQGVNGDWCYLAETRLGAGIVYNSFIFEVFGGTRHMSGIDFPGLSDADFNDIQYGLTVKFLL